MCDRLPALTAEAAADRLAECYDVPELTAGMLDRERTRDHGKFLKTTHPPARTLADQPGGWLSPAAQRAVPEYYRWHLGIPEV